MLLRLGIALLCTLAATPGVQAGLYNTAEEHRLGTTYAEFRQTMTRLRRAALTKIDVEGRYVPLETPLRKRALLALSLLDLAKPDALQARRWDADTYVEKLSADQCLNCSAYLLRLGRSDDAIALLMAAKRKYPDHFLLLANLGTAWQAKGVQQFAVRYLERGLSMWPEQFESLPQKDREYFLSFGWDADRFRHFRRAESYHLRWVQRGADKGIPDIAGVLFQSPDGKPLRFVNDDGAYEAGRLAASERAKLPPDHMEIVKQLLIWFPADQNLYWLLGELLNAQGGRQNIQAAYRIFDDLVYNMGNRNPLVKEHRRILREHLDQSQPRAEPPAVADDKDAGKPPIWNPDPWQMMGVGFLAGALVMLFATWQVRILTARRRRRAH